MNQRDVTALLDRVADGTIEAQAERILETLGRAHTPQSAAAIADELDIRGVDVLAALVTLHGAGRVARIAGATADERDRWAPVAVSSPSETITCRAYREHARLGHRRDPGTGRFRCYVCEPDVGQLAATV
jgi:hypothetical protein